MLSVARTTTPLSTSCAAAVATEAYSASPGAISGLASPAALMETNATIMPSMGERPTARKATAPSGMRTTYAESDRNLPSTPPSATPRTTVRGDRPDSIRRASASKSPDRSATATPSITVSTVPSGPKVTKEPWAPVIRSRTASPDRALRTPTTPPEEGSSTCRPEAFSAQLTRARTPHRIQNSQNGCGSAFPARSTRSRSREPRPPSSGSVARTSAVRLSGGLMAASWEGTGKHGHGAAMRGETWIRARSVVNGTRGIPGSRRTAGPASGRVTSGGTVDLMGASDRHDVGHCSASRG